MEKTLFVNKVYINIFTADNRNSLSQALKNLATISCIGSRYGGRFFIA